MERPSRFHENAPANFDDAEWANIEIGRPWSEQGYTDYEGGAWYRTKLTIAADRVRPVQMYIEGKYQSIEVYVNAAQPPSMVAITSWNGRSSSILAP